MLFYNQVYLPVWVQSKVVLSESGCSSVGIYKAFTGADITQWSTIVLKNVTQIFSHDCSELLTLSCVNYYCS